jgi:uncharacterized membrane protein
MNERANSTTASETEASDASTSEAQEALHTLLHQGVELYAYFSHYVQAQLDLLKMSGRQVALWAVIGILGAIVAVSALVMGVILFLTGLSSGVGAAVGGVLWLGQLIVGIGLLILFGIAILIGKSRMQGQARTQRVQDYAERQQQQRLQFGRSAADRANHAEI